MYRNSGTLVNTKYARENMVSGLLPHIVREKGPGFGCGTLDASTRGLPRHWTEALKKCYRITVVKEAINPCGIKVPTPTPATKTSIFTAFITSCTLYTSTIQNFIFLGIPSYTRASLSARNIPPHGTSHPPFTFYPSTLYSGISSISLALSPPWGLFYAPLSFPKALSTSLWSSSFHKYLPYWR